MEQSHDRVSQLPPMCLLGKWLGSRQADSHGILTTHSDTARDDLTCSFGIKKVRDSTSATGR